MRRILGESDRGIFLQAQRVCKIGIIILGSAFLLLPASAQKSEEGSENPAAVISSPTTVLPASTKMLNDWRAAVTHTLLPKKGCFTSFYPSTQWQEVACATTPALPTVASGSIEAKVTGYITTAVGSFDSVTGVTEETGQIAGTGGQVPNVFSLQLNQIFSTPMCSGAVNPAICTGFQQFVFQNPGLNACGGGNACAFMQYWLRDWGSSDCPSGWTYYNNQGNENCFMNSNAVIAPQQTIANLANLSVMGQANQAGMDAVIFSTGSALYAVTNEDSILDLAQDWHSVSFNIYGQCCETQATFNEGSTIVVRTSMDSGTTSAPSCLGSSSVAALGESNNLSFASPPAALAGTAPALVFTESSAGSAASPCASAVELPSGWLTDIHDFNDDSYSDIAWRDTSGDVAIWLMNGASVLSAGVAGSVPGWSVVGQRDFNGDGKADLLWYSAGNVAMWFMNGTSVSSGVGLGNVTTAWTVAGTGDFNGNGLGDVLWQSSGGGTKTLAMWLMNGATVTASAIIGSVPAQWSVVGIGDFNGDGRSDILWQDSSGNVAIWFMNAASISSAASIGNVAGWNVVGTGDFNGDGVSDIIWRNNAGYTAVWLMNGSTSSPAPSSASEIGGVPISWSVAQIGDYDGNGVSDILWQDTSGDVAIWFMNGTAVSSVANLGNVSGWTVQGAGAD